MTQQPQPAPDELVTSATLARELGVPQSTLRRHVAAGSAHIPPPAGTVGRAHYWLRSTLDIAAIKAAWPKRGGYRPRRPRATEGQ